MVLPCFRVERGRARWARSLESHSHPAPPDQAAFSRLVRVGAGTTAARTPSFSSTHAVQWAGGGATGEIPSGDCEENFQLERQGRRNSRSEWNRAGGFAHLTRSRLWLLCYPGMQSSSLSRSATWRTRVQHPAPPPLALAHDVELFQAIQVAGSGWQRRAFDRYQRLVRGLLIKSLGPTAEVDDLIHEVFLGFFESAGNIRSAEGLRSYIVSIAMNTARREVRRQKRRRLLFWKDEDSDAVERAANVDDPKAKAALLQLNDILASLGTEERLAYVLHQLEGLGLLEVAAALGVSHSTAKRRVRSASAFVQRRASRNALLSEYIRDKAGGDS